MKKSVLDVNKTLECHGLLFDISAITVPNALGDHFNSLLCTDIVNRSTYVDSDPDLRVA
jgi:hypothetical protein